MFARRRGSRRGREEPRPVLGRKTPIPVHAPSAVIPEQERVVGCVLEMLTKGRPSRWSTPFEYDRVRSRSQCESSFLEAPREVHVACGLVVLTEPVQLVEVLRSESEGGADREGQKLVGVSAECSLGSTCCRRDSDAVVGNEDEPSAGGVRFTQRVVHTVDPAAVADVVLVGEQEYLAACRRSPQVSCGRVPAPRGRVDDSKPVVFVTPELCELPAAV